MTPPPSAPGPARHAIGVDVGGTKIEAIVLDPSGAPLWRRRVATPTADYDATVDCVATLVARAEAELGLSGCTVGVGTPGTLTSAGLIKNANSTCLNARPLADDLARAMGREVRIANDANCLALSEATDGAAAGAPVVFAVILGTGVGAGVAVHGRLLVGPNGLAGEWGHNPLPWAEAAEHGGAACFCGQRGCIETWLSGPGLARDHLQHTGQRITAQTLGQRAGHGDADCRATLRRFESRLARALAQVINLLDPDVIVLAGGVSALPQLTRHVPQLWHHHVFGAEEPEDVRTRLVRAQHSDSSGVRGAAWLWRASDPLHGPFVAPPRA